jgi:hypothetical protein
VQAAHVLVAQAVFTADEDFPQCPIAFCVHVFVC